MDALGVWIPPPPAPPKLKDDELTVVTPVAPEVRIVVTWYGPVTLLTMASSVSRTTSPVVPTRAPTSVKVKAL